MELVISGAEADVVKRSNFIHSRFFLNAGALNALLDGLINSADFGKIVNVFFKIHSKFYLCFYSYYFQKILNKL